MATVHPHLILKLIGLLPAGLDRQTLAQRLDQSFGPWGFALEDGSLLNGAQAIAWLEADGSLAEENGLLGVTPAWRCRKESGHTHE